MVIDTVEDLLFALRRLELLTPDQIEEVAVELGPFYDNPQTLGEYLVDAGWLTTFQFEALFEGRWEELSIGPYLVLDRLGEGGVGEVFKAWDTVRGGTVAVKLLRQGLPGQSDALRQFRRELEVLTRLNHPNIIKTFDAQHLDRVDLLTMEYVEGTDLQNYVQRQGPLAVDQACDYIRQAALGLQHAHQLGLIHRDVKPANLFLIPSSGPSRRGSDALVKVLDWGLARVMPAPGEVIDTCGSDYEAERGRLIGTADYIAPEQAQDPWLVDTRADIYSLGCTFHFLLTSKPPFPGASLMQKLLRHQQESPPSVRDVRDDVPEEVDRILRRMLAKKPEERFQIPLLVVASLRHFCPGALPSSQSVIRPPSSGSLGTLRPSSSRPSTVTNLRPSTAPNLPPRRT